MVDDHTGMREGISAIINSQPDMVVVGEAADGPEAIRQFSKFLPNVTLADVNLPSLGGFEVLGIIRKASPGARCIMITALNDGEMVREAFRAGAEAFLHKDMLRRELLTAIRAVHGGQKFIPRVIAELLKDK